MAIIANKWDTLILVPDVNLIVAIITNKWDALT